MLTRERLKDVLHYDPETGVCTRLIWAITQDLTGTSSPWHPAKRQAGIARWGALALVLLLVSIVYGIERWSSCSEKTALGKIIFPPEHCVPSYFSRVLVYKMPAEKYAKVWFGKSMSGLIVSSPFKRTDVATFDTLARKNCRIADLIVINGRGETWLRSQCGAVDKSNFKFAEYDTRRSFSYINDGIGNRDRITDFVAFAIRVSKNEMWAMCRNEFLSSRNYLLSQEIGLANQNSGGKCTYYYEAKGKNGDSFFRCHPPYERRFIATLFLVFGGLGISIFSIHYLDEKRFLLRSSLIGGGWLLCVFGLLLWAGNFFPFTWNWII